MVTVNFSVPEEVNEAFNQAFENMDRDKVLANLMRKAVDEMQKQTRRQEAFRILTQKRADRPDLTDDEIRSARSESRQ